MQRRYSRRVLEMTDEELAAVIAVAMPGRRIDELRRDERQEIAMKWLFGHGLSMNHRFMLEVEDDEIYVLLSNRQTCSCCAKSEDVVSIKSFDKSPLGSSLVIYNANPEGGTATVHRVRRSSSTSALPCDHLHVASTYQRSKSDTGSTSEDQQKVKQKQQSISERRGQKIQPIKVQPLGDIELSKKNKEEKPDPPDTCWKSLMREYGNCCVNIWSSC